MAYSCRSGDSVLGNRMVRAQEAGVICPTKATDKQKKKKCKIALRIQELKLKQYSTVQYSWRVHDYITGLAK